MEMRKSEARSGIIEAAQVFTGCPGCDFFITARLGMNFSCTMILDELIFDKNRRCLRRKQIDKKDK